MARGTVITARGQAMNMEELILAAKRPMSMRGVDQKDKVEAKKVPAKQMNIRGFVPSAVGVASPVQPIKEKKADVIGPSMADLTAVNLNSSKRRIERPENADKVANETLREIMGELEQFKARDTADQGQRRTRKAS